MNLLSKLLLYLYQNHDMNKIVAVVFAAFFVCSINAKIYCQDFIRIYNSHGKKIAKGKLLSGTDSTIEIKRGAKNDTLAIRNISFIKTRRSAGHNIAAGTAIGVGVGLVFGIISSSQSKNDPDPNSWAGFGTGLAGIASPVVGAAIGGITAVLRTRETFKINGDLEKWKVARADVLDKK